MHSLRQSMFAWDAVRIGAKIWDMCTAQTLGTMCYECMDALKGCSGNWG